MNSYSNIYIMLVWGVKYRLGLISHKWSQKLYGVIGQLCKEVDCMPLAINGDKDHVHVVISLGNDAPAIKKIIKVLKARTTRWINENRLCVGRFGWQEGSARFSYDKNSLPTIIKYVNNQAEHHKRWSFREELELFYKSYGIDYDSKYVVDDPE